jgi:hypothetical protein
MLTFLLAATLFAEEPLTESAEDAIGELVIDARLATEILVDGETIGQLFRPSVLTFEVSAGKHELRIYTNGSPDDISIVVPAAGTTRVLVGRSGLSVDKQVSEDPEAGLPVPVQLRVAGSQGVRLSLDNKRYQVEPGEQIDIELMSGRHQLSVRNDEGTVIWAKGTLTIEGPDAVLVQFSEGRMPEVSGRGRFASGR